MGKGENLGCIGVNFVEIRNRGGSEFTHLVSAAAAAVAEVVENEAWMRAAMEAPAVLLVTANCSHNLGACDVRLASREAR